MNALDPLRTRSPLAQRLIIWTVLFSSIITLGLTAYQLIRDYRHDLGVIEENFDQIRIVHLPTLAKSLWATDQTRLELQLQGMLQMPDMQYLELREGHEIWAHAGTPASGNVLSRTLPILHSQDGRPIEIGQLTAVASLDGVYTRLANRAFVILLSNGVKTFLVATFLLVIFHYFVGRHVLFIARRFKSPPGEVEHLHLDRRTDNKQSPDELDRLVSAINDAETSRAREMDSLRASEQRWRELIEQANDPIFLIEPGGGRIVDANRRATEIYGYSRSALQAMTVKELGPRHADFEADRALRQLREHGAALFEREHKTRDGRNITVEVSSRLVTTAAGPIIISLVRDVTRRHHDEEAVRRSEKLLAEAERVALLGSFEWRTSDDRQHWSRGLYRILGVEQKHVKPSIDEFLNYTHPADREAVRHYIEQAVSMGKSIDFDQRIVRPDHSVRLLSVHLIAVRDAEQRAARLIGVCRDISDAMRETKERDSLLSDLMARNTELEHFVHTIAHDLKTPLITIGGLADMLARDLQRSDTRSAADDLAEISQATSQMRKNIDDLLALSRAGRVVAQYEVLELNVWVGEVIQSLKRRIERAAAQLRVTPNLPTITADRLGFRRVFENLIDNALKYRHLERDPIIEIGAQEADEECRLYVRDNGIGIRPEDREKIFGVFQRVRSAVEGSGVGLAISRRVIEAHGGRMWVESTFGRGSTFWIGLPSTLLLKARNEQ